MKTIVLTGGGTAGHVTPNIALIEDLRLQGYKTVYIGSKNGMEKELIEKTGLKYYGISSGKLRRYFDKKNFTDIFNVLKGIAQANSLMHKIRPNVIFSKGGFVAVPVVIAGFINKVPVVVHESDMTPGLANKIAIPFAKTVCTTFPEAVEHISGGKGIYTGTPIRKELFNGSKERGLNFCGFNLKKPVLLVMGGSQGSAKINAAIKNGIHELTDKFQVVHLRGKGNLDDSLSSISGYKQFEYISDELKDLFACCDMVISRAGSNAICEFLALKKPMLLIPLSRAASRGDQILNAASYEKQGFAAVIQEENLTAETLVNTINMMYNNKSKYLNAMEGAGSSDSIKKIIEQINKALN